MKNIKDFKTFIMNENTNVNLPKGEFYMDFDEEHGYCVFYTDDDDYGKSGKCYYSGYEKKDAQEYCDERNEHLNKMILDKNFDIKGELLKLKEEGKRRVILNGFPENIGYVISLNNIIKIHDGMYKTI